MCIARWNCKDPIVAPKAKSGKPGRRKIVGTYCEPEFLSRHYCVFKNQESCLGCQDKGSEVCSLTQENYL